MEKIDSKLISDINNIDISKYFIMPFYSFESLVYIKITNDSINWFNNNLKEISGYKKISNALKKMYKASRFFNYDITIIGFLNKKKGKQTLIIFDLLLNDEIIKKIQSKKYSIRLDNIKNRFVDLNNKTIIPMFAQKCLENKIDDISIKMIESDSWDGFLFYKDKPYNFDDEDNMASLLFYKLWNMDEGKIVDYEIGSDENNEPVVNAIYVINDKDEKIKICGNLAEIKKIKPQDINEETLNKRVIFKYCIMQNENNSENVMLTKLIKLKDKK